MFWIGRVSNKILLPYCLLLNNWTDKSRHFLLSAGSTYLQPPFNIDKHSFESVHHSTVEPSQLGCEITN